MQILGQGNKAKVKGRGEEVVHAYNALLTKTRELAELAAALGGSSGELLLDECAAKVNIINIYVYIYIHTFV